MFATTENQKPTQAGTAKKPGNFRIYVFVCLCLTAAALRRHRSIPRCAPLIVSDRLLSSRRLAPGCSPARHSKPGLSPRLKIAGLRMRTGGFPTYIAPCFSFRLCPVSSREKTVSRATSCHLREGRPKPDPSIKT